MKKIFVFLVAAILAATSVWAVPALPGLITVTQSDGTSLQIQVVGDEFHHGITTADGLTISRGSDGDFYYTSASGITTMRAHNAKSRNAAETSFLAQNRGQFTMAALHEAKVKKGLMRSRGAKAAAPSRVGQSQIPTMGSPRVPIILIQYKDKKMSHTMNSFEQQYKTGAKSVYQYFVDQSNGKYTPQYDLYGIYELDNDRSTYGANSGGNDVGVARMVGEAIDKAGDEIDWSLYDNDGDGEADVCIVVYAGVGEAQASYTVPESIWPCQWNLSSGEYYGDGTGPRYRNGVTINRFAVFNEISGSSDSGTTMDGIGTFCHEFSHCLGLPDFYATNYGGYYGMGYWSLMDSGCYNGVAVRGDTPVGYSAYEKNFMSWIDLVTPEDNTFYTLPVFNSKSLDADVALKVTGLNDNEYWILENRRKQGWDELIEDEGVLITHFTYLPDRWEANTVNNQSVQLASVIPADNTLSTSSEDGDLYGESNHTFTGQSTPAMKANMNAEGTLASTTGGAGTITNKQFTEIALNSDGTVSLWYNLGKEVPQLTDTTDITPTSFTAHWSEVENAVSYTLQVNDVNYVPQVELIGSLDGTVYTGSYGSVTLQAPWGGTDVIGGNGALYFNNYSSWSSYGNITYSIPAGYQDETFTMKITTVLGSYGSGNLSVGTPQTSAAGHSFSKGETFAWIVTASSGDMITITSTDDNYSPEMALIEVYRGDATQETLLQATETGDANVRTIAGITGNSYTVEGLNENALYNVKVRALYTDNTEGGWSDTWLVQLHGGGKPGDVNLDGSVDIEDANIVINIILETDQASNYDGRANLNSDDKVDIEDLNMIISIILSNAEAK